MKPRRIIQSADEVHAHLLAITHDAHLRYAVRCDADFVVLKGYAEPGVHAAWNRIAMMLDAFADGVDKVVWLDADTLVVNQDVSIFSETDDDVAFQMVRVPGSTAEWGRGEDIWNDGVMVANRAAIEGLTWMWSKRNAVPEPHHVATALPWEGNWMLDWMFGHREQVAELSVRFNWMPPSYDMSVAPRASSPWDAAVPSEDAVIRAWHGFPLWRRLLCMRHVYDEVYG